MDKLQQELEANKKEKTELEETLKQKIASISTQLESAKKNKLELEEEKEKSKNLLNNNGTFCRE